MEKLKTYFELEAGSVIFKIENGEIKFLTIYRVKMNDHTLPKGHVEDLESLEDASLRESVEETGYPIKIGDFIDSFEYKVKESINGVDAHIIRRAYFFEGEVIGELNNKVNPDEREGKIVPVWLSFEEIMGKFSYDTDKKLIKKIYEKYTK